MGHSNPRQQERRRAPRRQPARTPHGQKRIPGRLVAARHHPDRPDDPGGRRHTRQRQTLVRQSPPARARRPAGRHESHEPGDHGRRGLRLPAARGHRRQSPGRFRHSGRVGQHGLSVRSRADENPARGSARQRQRRRQRNRHGNHARTGTARRMGSALRRSASRARSLRRGAPQSHPGHRRTGHADQRGPAPAWSP